MRVPTVRELLDAWERGLSQSPLGRALTLLGASCDRDERVDLASLSIGQRNTRLIRMRESMFGSTVVGLAPCPACREKLELSFDTADLLAPPTNQAVQDQAMNQDPSQVGPTDEASSDALSVRVAGRTWRFRLPNSKDLEAVSRERDSVAAVEIDAGQSASAPGEPSPRAASRLALLKRCLITDSTTADDATNDPPDEQAQRAIIERMSQCDPQADTHVSLDCPSCGHAWRAVFDVASFLWGEVHTWAQQTLREAHQLASAYGWFERDILTMTPLRRRMYLDMIRS